jgi:tRNA-Thr(GGU) m(6)t(6)A37 methyltransferase TsaA
MCGIDGQMHYALYPLGFLLSPLKEAGGTPRYGREGAPDAWLEVNASVAEGLEGIEVGDELIVITWLHQAQRDILKVHPRGDETVPLAGVFATRSPDRPNPLGFHRVTVLEIAGERVKVGPIEAIDGTPVVDIKPVLPNRLTQNETASQVHSSIFNPVPGRLLCATRLS